MSVPFLHFLLNSNDWFFYKLLFSEDREKERKKKLTFTPRTLSPQPRAQGFKGKALGTRLAFSRESRHIVERTYYPSNKSDNNTWLSLCRRSRSWSSLRFESASQKYTRCCHSNSGHLSQMNETNLAWWIFRQIYQVRYMYNVFKHINAYRKWSIKRRGAYLISLL